VEYLDEKIDRDIMGNAIEMIYPDGARIKQDYHLANRLTQFTNKRSQTIRCYKELHSNQALFANTFGTGRLKNPFKLVIIVYSRGHKMPANLPPQYLETEKKLKTA
jgi:hypothetical protein